MEVFKQGSSIISLNFKELTLGAVWIMAGREVAHTVKRLSKPGDKRLGLELVRKSWYKKCSYSGHQFGEDLIVLTDGWKGGKPVRKWGGFGDHISSEHHGEACRWAHDPAA